MGSKVVKLGRSAMMEPREEGVSRVAVASVANRSDKISSKHKAGNESGNMKVLC